MPKATDNKRERFYATKAEQNLILALRQYASVPIVNEGITKAMLRVDEEISRHLGYMKQEGMETTEEYKTLKLSEAPFEIVYLNWRELAKEYRGEK